MQSKNPEVSVVVPIFNEQGNITGLDRELKTELDKLGKEYEIIYVNDGSTDGSFKELKTLEDIVIVNLNRNYGQATAFDAGFKQAKGEIVVSMDGDGQNDPSDLPKLLEKLESEELDVVAGWRKSRSDKKGIKVLTRIGRMLRQFIISDTVHDTGCSFRVYRSEAVKSLDIGGEMHRYILALLRWKGFRIGEVVVNDRARIHGKSKYNYSKAFRGFIDLIYIWFLFKYYQRPLHLFGYMSFVAFAFAGLSTFWTIYGKIFMGLSLNRNGWALVAITLWLSGMMLFSFGIIIDLLIRNLFNGSPIEKRYYVRNVLNTAKGSMGSTMTLDSSSQILEEIKR
jgi:glycosyltransferase involved in cell wall biosynthesis